MFSDIFFFSFMRFLYKFCRLHCFIFEFEIPQALPKRKLPFLSLDRDISLRKMLSEKHILGILPYPQRV